MDLSQKRSSEVLKFVLRETALNDDFNWVKENLIAVGYGPTVPVFNEDGSLNKEKSRQWSFVSLWNAQEELFKILGGEIPKRLRDLKMSPEEKLEALKKLGKIVKSRS